MKLKGVYDINEIRKQLEEGHLIGDALLTLKYLMKVVDLQTAELESWRATSISERMYD